MANVAKQYKDTVYGAKAAKDGTGDAASVRPHSLRTWPPLTKDDHKAALKRQQDFFKEVQQKVPNLGLQSYETKRFLFYSDVPGAHHYVDVLALSG